MNLSRLAPASLILVLLWFTAGATRAQNSLSLDRTTYSVLENGGQASIVVRLTRANSDTVTVNYTTNDGTAVAGSDYTAVNGTLTFGPSETAKAVQVPIIDDLTAEMSEQFTFAISNPSGAAISGPNTATVTIQDNDNSGTVISFNPDAYSVAENAGSVTVTVTRSVSTGTDVVNYATTPGSATGGDFAAAGVDYQNASGSLTFAPGQTTRTIAIPIFDDSTVEGNESFAVNLSSQGGNYTFDRSTAVVTIVDNETSSVSFSAASYSVSENGGNATITLLRTGNTNTAARVKVTTFGGTATADDDYASVTSLNVDFAQGQTSATFNIPVFDDTRVEGTETFYISLTASPNSGVVIPGGTATAEVRIIDNENSNTVEFAGSDFSVNEQDGNAVITVRLNRSGSGNDTVTVQYFTETGSATPGSDYTPVSAGSNSRLTFGPGETIKTFLIPIVNDAAPENTETVGLVLANPTNATLGTASAATLGILDNDSAGVVQFSSSNYSVSENGGSVTLTVLLNRTGNTNSTVTATYTTAAGSAAQNRFGATSGQITFAPGSAVATITVPIVNDSVIQPPQTFFVVLTGATNASLGSPASAAVTIQDDDGLNTVEFDAREYGAVEIDGAVQVRVRAVRGGDPNQLLTVNLLLGAPGDTATNPADYQNPSSLTVTFPAGVNVQSVTIPITNNPTPQGVKTFTATLVNPGPFTSIGRQNAARITIFDNAGPNTVQFLTTAHRFREGDQAAIAVTVVRFGAFDVNGTTASYSTELRAGDTARAGINFTPVSGTIRFAALVNDDGLVVDNEHTKTIIIPVPNNELIEGDVTFHLTLTSSDVAQLGSISTTQITITDDDLGNVVQFVSAAYSVSEGAGNAVLTVRLIPNGDPSRATSVDYAASPISAFAGFDFSPVNGTLIFAPGETTKVILVPINNDDLFENSETFRVTLSNPSPGAIVGTPSSAIVTILDDDALTVNPTFQFSTSEVTTSNAVGTATVNVLLSRGSNASQTYTVQYRTSDISAIAGIDYTETSGTLTFGPNETTKSINVPLIAQAPGQPTRQFRITLLNPSAGAVLGDIPSIVVTIINPDVSTKLVNVSTRGPVESGDSVMIAGFMVRGSASKQIVVRGTGPTLLQYGIPNAVLDTTLTLVDGNGNALTYNDDWNSNSAADVAAIRANRLEPSDPREAAIFASVGPGNYTAILRGKSNGVGLVEVYDVAPTAASRLINISTRGKVNQNDAGTMITGFIVAPPANAAGSAQRVCVRVIAPSLSSFGVSGVMNDPTLELYRGQQRILTNDNWKIQSGAGLGSRAEIEGAGFAPNDDREAVILTTLDPGTYSAIVRGKNNTTGVALVEVYQLD